MLKGRETALSGAGSSITLDFGKEVSGLTTLHFAGSDGPQKVGVAFSGDLTVREGGPTPSRTLVQRVRITASP